MADIPAGEWGTLNLSVPVDLDVIRVTINDVTDFLLAGLDISLAALNLVKTFSVSYLDPVASLVQAIIDELDALAVSLNGIGLYVTGDWSLLQYPYTDLQGGFSEFERRMIARMTDRTDPTRPDVSSSITTFGAFFYLSTEVIPQPDSSKVAQAQANLDALQKQQTETKKTAKGKPTTLDGQITEAQIALVRARTTPLAGKPLGIERLLTFIEQITGFFNLSVRPQGGLPTPSIENVLYGNQATSVISGSTSGARFDSLVKLTQLDPTPPNVARVVWKVTPPTTGNPASPFPQIPPKDFLITVSTLPDGIRLMYDRPLGNSSTKKGKKGKKVQPRESGKVVDPRGIPVVLHGGAEMLAFDAPTFGWNSSIDADGNAMKGRCRVYGVGDPAKNSIIPLELLDQTQDRTEFLFQRTFTTDELETSVQWATDEFSLELRLEDLPYHAVINMVDGEAEVGEIYQPATYYVRVATATPTVINRTTADGEARPVGINQWVWDLQTDAAKPNATASGEPFKIPVLKGEEAKSISAWSEPQTITFPNAHTSEYLEAVKTALLVLVLCRVDLTVIDSVQDLLGDAEYKSALEGKAMYPDVVLKATGLESHKGLLHFIYGDFDATVKTKGVTPAAFKQDLLNRITQVATDLYRKSGPLPDTEQAVVAATKTLRTVKWSEIFEGRRGKSDPTVLLLKDTGSDNDFTLLESIGQLRPNGTMSIGEGHGIALNPWCMGIATGRPYLLLREHPQVFKDRNPHFIEAERQPGVGGFDTPSKVEAKDVPAFLATLPAGLAMLYEHYILGEDKFGLDPAWEEIGVNWDRREGKRGDIVMEPEMVEFHALLEKLPFLAGSADTSPVFYRGRWAASNDSAITDGSLEVSFARTLLAEFQNGTLMREALLTLNVAAAAHQRSPLDGAWHSLRLGDMLPGITGFVDSITNWVESIKASVDSVADTLVAYIEYVEARIVELQQLIKRINSLLTSAFSLAFNLPKVAGLVLASKGSDGILSDFVNAENKPADSPLSYGAGVVVIAPAFPSFIAELFNVTDEDNLVTNPTGATGTALSADAITPIFGIEDISEEALNPPSDPEPDVL